MTTLVDHRPVAPDRLAEAVRIAAHDRDYLARLRRTGRVERAWGRYERHYPVLAQTFVDDIEARAFPPKNLAIRPRRKKPKAKR